MTSGRHSAIPSAIARDPSICFSMASPHAASDALGDGVVGGGRRRDVGFSDLAGKRLPDGRRDRMEVDDAGQRRKGAEQRCIGKRAPDMLQRQLARRHRAGMAFGKLRHDLGEMQLIEASIGVDEQIAVRPDPLEHVDRLEQRRVLHDQRVGLEDRLAQPDLLVVDTTEGDDRCAHALGAETRKCLGVLAFEERGNRQQLGRGHDALSAPAVNADLKHAPLLTWSGHRGCRATSDPQCTLSALARHHLIPIKMARAVPAVSAAPPACRQ